MSAARPMRARATLRWGMLDQVVASGATFVFIVVAATSITAPELGAIAFVFELYLLSVFVARGIAGDPLTTRFSGADEASLRHAIRAATTTALAVGTGLGLVLATVAWVADPPLRQVLLLGAVALPGLTLQDYVRAALIVQGRVRATFVNDAVWAVGQLPAMGIAIAVDPRATTVFGAWAAAGVLAALLGLVQLRCGIAGPRALRGWLRETRDLWPYYLVDNLLFQLTSSLLMFAVAAILGLAAMAGFRVAMTIYAPLSLIGRGVILVAIAMLARHRDDPVHVRRAAMLISMTLTPLALGWGLLTLLIPTAAGQALFGESWIEAEPVVFLASFVCASGLFGTGVVIGLRALGAGRHTVVGRLIVSIGACLAATAGGLAGDQHGLFLALAFVFPVQSAVWWALLRDATRSATLRVDQAKAST